MNITFIKQEVHMLKKKFPWMIAFVILAVLSIWAVVSQAKSYSFELMLSSLKNCHMPWLVAAVAGMAGNIYFEGKALGCLIRGLSPESPAHNGLVYSAADIYFSAITPSSTGGQPASAFFMVRDGIPVAKSTVILIVNVFMYTLALMTVGLISFIIHPSLLGRFTVLSRVLILIGVVLLILLCLLFILLLKRESWIRCLGRMCIGAAGAMHLVKDCDRLYSRLDKMLIQYRECVDASKGKGRMLLIAFIYNLLQRLSLLTITLFAFLAFGGSPSALADLFCIQSMVFIGAYSIPIPGAMGVADYLLIDGLGLIPGVVSAANLELVSRGISFYCCVLISVVIVAIGFAVSGKKKHK